MNSDKKGAILLASVLKAKGIQDVILCPGSRNAPLIITFTADSYFNCYSIVDERSAAFFALGICQNKKKPVAIACTSGSALMNMAPAVVEAYYQRLPLVVISADRPLRLVNQGESQTMDQRDVFKNYIRSHAEITYEPNTEEDLKKGADLISKLINNSIDPYFGPVHLNIRFEEPLYEESNFTYEVKTAMPEINELDLDIDEIREFRSSWNSKDKIIIICGQMFPDPELKKTLETLSTKGVVVLTESISNQNSNDFIPYIDKIIIPATEQEKEKLNPELLITIGGPLISRKIKNQFRPLQNLLHWHVDPLDHEVDAYGHLEKGIKMTAKNFLEHFISEPEKNMKFRDCWINKRDHVELRGEEIVSQSDFSDLKAFHYILNHLPDDIQFHVGNSSPIRYTQLFSVGRESTCLANRGISGIEGSVSTAVGASVNHEGTTLLVNGDLSSLYDSNAFWNNYLSPKFKIIVIQNGGGGIFKIIEGPRKVPEFKEFIETRHNKSFKKFSDFHDLAYFRASTFDELDGLWNEYINEKEKPALLEIDTSNINNEDVLMNFFEELKTENE